MKQTSTVVGGSILIRADMRGDEDLTVVGQVEGTITLSKTLIVEPSGVVKANIEVKNAIVAGTVVGNINASESVEITQQGRMVGDIAAPRIIIVDGASFRGRIDMGAQPDAPEGQAVPRERPSYTSRAKTPAPPPARRPPSSSSPSRSYGAAKAAPARPASWRPARPPQPEPPRPPAPRPQEARPEPEELPPPRIVEAVSEAVEERSEAALETEERREEASSDQGMEMVADGGGEGVPEELAQKKSE